MAAIGSKRGRPLLFAAAVVALVAAAGAGGASAHRLTGSTTYTIVDLGTLGGGSSSALALNDQGQVVGSSQRADSTTHAFVWQDGTMRDLGTLGGKNSHAYGISNQGVVVGSSETGPTGASP